MLMWLSEQLFVIDPGFAVFQYLTLRGILAACTALAISMVVGPYVIERLNQLQIGQTIRKDCLLYTSPSPRDRTRSRMPSSA